MKKLLISVVVLLVAIGTITTAQAAWLPFSDMSTSFVKVVEGFCKIKVQNYSVFTCGGPNDTLYLTHSKNITITPFQSNNTIYFSGQGSPGAQGPQGPQGNTGPQGPPGQIQTVDGDNNAAQVFNAGHGIKIFDNANTGLHKIVTNFNATTITCSAGFYMNTFNNATGSYTCKAVSFTTNNAFKSNTFTCAANTAVTAFDNTTGTYTCSSFGTGSITGGQKLGPSQANPFLGISGTLLQFRGLNTTNGLTANNVSTNVITLGATAPTHGTDVQITNTIGYQHLSFNGNPSNGQVLTFNGTNSTASWQNPTLKININCAHDAYCITPELIGTQVSTYAEINGTSDSIISTNTCPEVLVNDAFSRNNGDVWLTHGSPQGQPTIFKQCDNSTSTLFHVNQNQKLDGEINVQWIVPNKYNQTWMVIGDPSLRAKRGFQVDIGEYGGFLLGEQGPNQNANWQAIMLNCNLPNTLAQVNIWNMQINWTSAVIIFNSTKGDSCNTNWIENNFFTNSQYGIKYINKNFTLPNVPVQGPQDNLIIGNAFEMNFNSKFKYSFYNASGTHNLYENNFQYDCRANTGCIGFTWSPTVSVPVVIGGTIDALNNASNPIPTTGTFLTEKHWKIPSFSSLTMQYLSPGDLNQFGNFFTYQSNNNHTETLVTAQASQTGTNAINGSKDWNGISTFNGAVILPTTVKSSGHIFTFPLNSGTFCLTNSTVACGNGGTVKNISYPASYIIYKNGTSYYEKNSTNAILLSSVNPETVIQDALTHRGNTFITNGTYIMSAGFTGLELYNNDHLIMDKQAKIIVPSGYSKYVFAPCLAFPIPGHTNCFVIGEGSTNIDVEGGYVTEASPLLHNWIGIDMNISCACGFSGIYFNNFHDININGSGTVIGFYGDGSIDNHTYANDNSFQDIQGNHWRVGIDFNYAHTKPPSLSYGFNKNFFKNLHLESFGDSYATNGTRNIQHYDEEFYDVKVWDLNTNGTIGNISPNATDTFIVGGSMTSNDGDNHGQPSSQFVDKGSNTFINDLTGLKLQGSRTTTPFNQLPGLIYLRSDLNQLQYDTAGGVALIVDAGNQQTINAKKTFTIALAGSKAGIDMQAPIRINYNDTLIRSSSGGFATNILNSAQYKNNTLTIPIIPGTADTFGLLNTTQIFTATSTTINNLLLGGNENAQSNKIINLANATLKNDAVNARNLGLLGNMTFGSKCANGQQLQYQSSNQTWICVTPGSGSGTITGALNIGKGTGSFGWYSSQSGGLLKFRNATAGSGISITGNTTDNTITNSGVTSITGTANNVTASASTGAITLNLGQNVVITGGSAQTITKGLAFTGTTNHQGTTNQFKNGTLLVENNAQTFATIIANKDQYKNNTVTFPLITGTKDTFALLNATETFLQKQTFTATATNAGINIGNVGSAPSTLSTGDCWFLNTVLQCRTSSPATVTMADTGSVQSITGAKTLSSIRLGFAYKTADYTPASSDSVLIMGASGGVKHFTLPAISSSSISQIIYTLIKNDTSSNAVVIYPKSPNTIDGATSLNLTSQFDGMTIMANSGQTTWHVLSTTTRTSNFTQPANQTAISSQAIVMYGGYATFTPRVTSNVEINVRAQASDSTLSSGCRIDIRYGTSNLGGNGAAAAGTVLGNNIKLNVPVTGDTIEYSDKALLTTATVGTKYFFDLGVASLGGGTCTLNNPSWLIRDG